MRKNNPKNLAILIFLEIVVVFAIFVIFGAWPIPDSNEPYYVGKAIHFWNPDRIPNDTFLKSKDAHWTFYVAFGWLAFFFSPHGMAWIGRAVTWGLLAWSWQRLSYALIPLRWMSIPTALALAYYVDAFHMAGEWILGGVEGKSFAFPFVFFGLEAMVRGRWHRTWIFLGIASAFHVLVGGWSVLVAGFVWIVVDAPQFLRAAPRQSLLRRIPWGLFLGGAISLLGLVPALMLDHGTSKELVREAHQVYVFERIYHHLVPYKFPWTFVARFFALVAVWAVLCRTMTKGGPRHRRFDAFIWGTLLLTAIGFTVAYGLRNNQPLAAEILRFYWFRLSDVAVPMGVAVGALLHLLPTLRMLRRDLRNEKKIDLPTVPGWLLLFGVPFAVYLLIDRMIFHYRLYEAKVVAEPAIPWTLTLFLCGIGLLVLNRYKPKDSGLLRGVLAWGTPLLYFTLLFLGPLESLKTLGDARTYLSFSRVEPGRPHDAYYWIDVCRWISDPENTPKTAKFWVPREGTTFKWHTGRSDVGIWKDVPQDAVGLLRWREMMHDLHYYKDEDGHFKDDRSLTVLLWWKKPWEIEQLRQKYAFDYIVSSVYPDLGQHKTLEMVYENEKYRVWRVLPYSSPGSDIKTRQ